MPHEIKCPQCGTVFQVDEGDYAQIAAQVRTAEFQHDIEEHEKLLAKEREQAVAQTRADMQEALVQTRESLQQAIAERDAEISRLAAQIESSTREFEAAKQLAITQATSELEKQRDSLSMQMQQAQQTHMSEIQHARVNHEAAMKDAEAQHRIQLMEKDAEKEKALSELKSENEQFASKMREEIASRDAIIKYKDEEIEHYKDMKARLSTKMVGESLEQHCLTEFNRIRATAFPHASFGKDNDASEGSKGDFIYREKDDDGNEIISIMFEMKNESEDSTHKHKNEDFLRKLDHDREIKGCEYAILVTLLEPENELYNDGIVDMSYLYEKMYVIRPQFFILLIGILRNAALNSMEYKRKFAAAQRKNIDVTHFEEKLDQFKNGFGNNIQSAHAKFEKAIADIDKTIKDLQKVREDLVSSGRQLSLADNKLDSLTIRKLTYGNPTMKEKFKEAREITEAKLIDDKPAYEVEEGEE